ncbi:hypothetical protein AAF712_007004 [Marasmius tenuissimus]|uniref:Berberine/berberine-like domain-containing protein n=1 Tax=Marasmius tenuissimus TaxID=585030 RepID=A0ABR2ZY52_9AGAR
MPRSVWEDTGDFEAFTEAVRGILDDGGIAVTFAMRATREVAGDPENAVLPAWREAEQLVITAKPLQDGEPLDQVVEGQATVTNMYDAALKKVAPGSGAYLNEADSSEPDFKTAFYGANYERLLAIKDKWDPEQILYGSIALHKHDMPSTGAISTWSTLREWWDPKPPTGRILGLWVHEVALTLIRRFDFTTTPLHLFAPSNPATQKTLNASLTNSELSSFKLDSHTAPDMNDMRTKLVGTLDSGEPDFHDFDKPVYLKKSTVDLNLEAFLGRNPEVSQSFAYVDELEDHQWPRCEESRKLGQLLDDNDDHFLLVGELVGMVRERAKETYHHLKYRCAPP